MTSERRDIVPAGYTTAESLKGASDEFVKRPLWEFPAHERRAVMHERARRFGVPDAHEDFDPEYH